MSDNRYNQRGVSASKEDVHQAIKNIDKGIFPQAFCKIIPDILGGDDAFCNIMHADGAGTKSSLAYVYWKETGDISVWKGIAQDAIIMNIDDLICVGATDNILLSSTIGRNKNLIPGEVIAAIINGTEEILADLRSQGISIYSTGGETADVGDLVRTIIVDSTVTCRMERSKVISKLVLSPTRTYAPVIKKVLEAHRDQIDGIVHCSGGAQTKVLHFVNDDVHVIKDNLFPVPPLFKLIQEQSGTDWKEMYKVFNMGHRMELYVPAEIAASIIEISESFGIEAQVIGRVEALDKKQVTVVSEFGEFVYN
jgi:phosphoribosylaminoimidazole (AIR) synthetase